jgi:SNF2 family DNA or RNA helicase
MYGVESTAMIKLHQYQEKYISDLPKNCIMGADVGTGKTFMSLEHYVRNNEGKPLLVLAPASKVKTNDWQRDIQRYLGDKEPAEWWVVSYDKFARNWQEYAKVDNLCVIADECHFTCNSQTKRGKAVRRVGMLADQFVGLSATPLPNGWRSMENFAIIFGLARNKTEFVRRFINIDRSRGFPMIMGYNEVGLMERFWNSFSKPLDRDGIIELPEVTSLGERIKMPPKFEEEYSTMKRKQIAPDGELLDSPSKLFARLRQSLTPLRRDKLKALIESTEEHIVVFYNFDNERDMILDVLRSLETPRRIYEQSGHNSVLPIREEWDIIEPSVTLAQYQSASTAIELTYASVTIFLSPTYSYANFHQAKGRTHRPGQTRKVVFYLLSVEDSLDSDVWKALKHKLDFSEKVWIKENPNGIL